MGSAMSQSSAQPVTPLPLGTPVYPDEVRFVCMSDTHNHAASFSRDLPPGDVFLHAGDFTYRRGRPEDVEKFNTFLATLPYTHKLVIAGNHELLYDEDHSRQRSFYEYLRRKGLNNLRRVISANCTYLENSETTVFGLRVYGTRWKLGREKDEVIPGGIDVLITHTPPKGHGDLKLKLFTRTHAGCRQLLSHVQSRVRPKVHVFGHIHEGYGMTTDGVTTFINASNVNKRRQPVNKPVIFDLPLPAGVTKN